MKLIREEIESVDFIVEKNGKKSSSLRVSSSLQQISRNNRLYPMETMRKEVRRYNENHVNSGSLLGGAWSPDGPTVNLDRVSIKIVSKESGDNFIGKALKSFQPRWVRSPQVLFLKV